MPKSRKWMLVGFALAAACGGDLPPDRSGRYGTRVIDSATDCSGAEAPPSIPGFILVLDQRGDSVSIAMNPIVRMGGRFEGDHLTAGMKVVEPIGLPDSLLARAKASDSLDTITYRLEADFAGDGFEGEYVIRSADMGALFEGRDGRCSYRYELAGEVIPAAPAQLPGAAPAPPGESR